MSQLPPNPYGNPSPYPPPVGGYPPTGYPPQGYGAPQRTSGAAITSLVLGLLGCVPFVTGLLAAIFGIVGLRSTSKPGVKGRGLAIAGLILGILSLVGWAIYSAVAGVAMYAFLTGGMNPMIAQGLFQNMSSGNTAAALKLCQPGTAGGDVQATIDQMKPYGRMTAFHRSNTSTINGDTTMDGTIDFASGGSHSFKVEVDKGANGVPLVKTWELEK